MHQRSTLRGLECTGYFSCRCYSTPGTIHMQNSSWHSAHSRQRTCMRHNARAVQPTHGVHGSVNSMLADLDHGYALIVSRATATHDPWDLGHKRPPPGPFLLLPITTIKQLYQWSAFRSQTFQSTQERLRHLTAGCDPPTAGA